MRRVLYTDRQLIDEVGCGTVTWAENWRAYPLFWRGRWAPSNTMSSGPWPTFVPSVIWIHPAVWPQQIWAEK